jgi:hypothetical protein
MRFAMGHVFKNAAYVQCKGTEINCGYEAQDSVKLRKHKNSSRKNTGESPCGGGVGSGAVRGESVLVGGLKGCYWWKTV